MPSLMDGLRNFTFTPEAGSVLSLSGTDFWLDYKAVRAGADVERGVVLRNVWEHTTLLSAGIVRRDLIEQRMKAICDALGVKGTLVVDSDVPGVNSKTFNNITLVDISADEISRNELFEYNLSFTQLLPQSMGAVSIPRTIQWGLAAEGDKIILSSDTLMLRTSVEDRTQFIPVARAAPIRMVMGPGLKIIRLSGVRQLSAGATNLARRQAQETALNGWLAQVGSSRQLRIDGTGADNGTLLGTCHLRSVNAGEFLPDAVTYDLEFVTSYGVS